MKNWIKIIIITTILSVPMAACGVKPKNVEAPQGSDKDAFPRTYPSK